MFIPRPTFLPSEVTAWSASRGPRYAENDTRRDGFSSDICCFSIVDAVAPLFGEELAPMFGMMPLLIAVVLITSPVLLLLPGPAVFIAVERSCDDGSCCCGIDVTAESLRPGGGGPAGGPRTRPSLDRLRTVCATASGTCAFVPLEIPSCKPGTAAEVGARTEGGGPLGGGGRLVAVPATVPPRPMPVPKVFVFPSAFPVLCRRAAAIADIGGCVVGGAGLPVSGDTRATVLIGLLGFTAAFNEEYFPSTMPGLALFSMDGNGGAPRGGSGTPAGTLCRRGGGGRVSRSSWRARADEETSVLPALARLLAAVLWRGGDDDKAAWPTNGRPAAWVASRPPVAAAEGRSCGRGGGGRLSP